MVTIPIPKQDIFSILTNTSGNFNPQNLQLTALQPETRKANSKFDLCDIDLISEFNFYFKNNCK